MTRLCDVVGFVIFRVNSWIVSVLVTKITIHEFTRNITNGAHLALDRFFV